MLDSLKTHVNAHDTMVSDMSEEVTEQRSHPRTPAISALYLMTK